MAEAGVALVLESISYSSALSSVRVESRFTDWEVRTNVEVQMLQSMGLAPIKRQVPFPQFANIDDQNSVQGSTDVKDQSVQNQLFRSGERIGNEAQNQVFTELNCFRTGPKISI